MARNASICIAVFWCTSPAAARARHTQSSQPHVHGPYSPQRPQWQPASSKITGPTSSLPASASTELLTARPVAHRASERGVSFAVGTTLAGPQAMSPVMIVKETMGGLCCRDLGIIECSIPCIPARAPRSHSVVSFAYEQCSMVTRAARCNHRFLGVLRVRSSRAVRQSDGCRQRRGRRACRTGVRTGHLSARIRLRDNARRGLLRAAADVRCGFNVRCSRRLRECMPESHKRQLREQLRQRRCRIGDVLLAAKASNRLQSNES